jgi:thiol peroxidase
MAEVKLKGNPIHTNGMMPHKAQKAPAVRGVDLNLKERSLADFKGKKKVICFVPSLDTSVCSMSAKKFNDAIKKKSNAAVIYVSTDTPFAIKRSCMELSEITPLSLIRSKKTAEDFGVLFIDGDLAGFCARAVVVLDENDHILYAELVEEVTHEPNYEAALSHL